MPKMNKFKKSEDSDSINRITRVAIEETNKYFKEVVYAEYKYNDCKNYNKKCNVCGNVFSDRPFENINGAGETLLGKIELFDEEYILCRKCSSELYKWMHNMKVGSRV